jgi:hypothetical protein
VHEGEACRDRFATSVRCLALRQERQRDGGVDYKAPARWIGCSPNTKLIAVTPGSTPRRNHKVGFQLVGGYVPKDGSRLADLERTINQKPLTT